MCSYKLLFLIFYIEIKLQSEKSIDHYMCSV